MTHQMTKEQFLSRFRGEAICMACGHHDRDIKPATCHQVENEFGESEISFIFGSDADFCTKCEKPWQMFDELIDVSLES